MASQITGVSIVCSNVCSDADKKKTLKLRVTGLWEGNSQVTGEFHSQRSSYAEKVSIWWRHHVSEHSTINAKRVNTNSAHEYQHWYQIIIVITLITPSLFPNYYERHRDLFTGLDHTNTLIITEMLTFGVNWCVCNHHISLCVRIGPNIGITPDLHNNDNGTIRDGPVHWTLYDNAGRILGLRPANERRRYKVTPFLIGLAQS